MFRFRKQVGVVLALLFCVFIFRPVFSAEETEKIVEGMKQGEFAMLLIKELGAQGLLPPAATTQDAFNFLEKKLGVVPPKGWDEEGTINKEELCYMLSLSKEACDAATFDELLATLKKKLADILWSAGIRAVSPQTISPAGGGGS